MPRSSKIMTAQRVEKTNRRERERRDEEKATGNRDTKRKEIEWARCEYVEM